MRKNALAAVASPPPSSSQSGERLKASALPEPGDSIGGKYTVVRKIGEGGMAVVYEVIHVRLGQRLAIKVLRPDVQDLDLVLARFEREARATAQLRSIHTARVVDVDTLPSGLPYMVLEYLEGRDLDAELYLTGPLPVVEAVDIVLQVADAMAEAHEQGVIHRDLKPSNLFVCKAGDRRVMKILDFGISRNEREESRITAADSYFGTPAYAAPEQLRDAASADGRSDVWSLGIILFELLTGHPPFQGTATQVIARVMTDRIPSPLELRPEIPKDLARVVLHALKRDTTQRYRSMRELAKALAPFGPSQSAAAALAPAQRGRGRLGEILVSEGLLTPEGLEQALIEQRRSGALLGRVLLEHGLVGRADLLAALARQQGIPVSLPPPSDREAKHRDAPTIHVERRPEQSPLRVLQARLERVPAARWVGLAVVVSAAVAVALAVLGH
jgi:tRNA A-37 threonylcarbamoyl transferase component Bud32